MENDYHSPYDHHDDQESDHLNHYEAPTCLARNPSGSLYIPSDPLVGQTTLDSRLRTATNFDTYSPHHQMTMTASGHHLTQSKLLNGSPCRSPAATSGADGSYSKSTLPSYTSQRLLAGGGGALSSHVNDGTTRTNGGIGGNSNNPLLHQSLVRRSSPNSSSQYSQHWRMKKDLGGNCSWKFAAILFMLLSVILVSALSYTTVSSYLNYSYDHAKACAVIETSSSNLASVASTGDPDEEIFSELGYQSDKSGTTQRATALSHQRASLPPDGSTFAHLVLGEKQSQVIPAYSYWNFQFQQKASVYVEFDIEVPRGSSIGLYARRNAIPTLTLNDVRDVFAGFRGRSARESSSSSTASPTVTHTANYYLESGHWFMSFYNDDGQPRRVGFQAEASDELTRNCPKGCSGHGECVLGQCQCQPGFDGPDCGQSICPLLCTGNGEYEDGQCRCYPGWKGLECQLRHDECEVADCNGHGKCVNGQCNCARGFRGDHCQETDCSDPLCSNHGFCVEGSCVCRKGWRGLNCDQLDHEARQCLPDCSSHGEFDLESQKCVCHGPWTGRDCSKERCNLDCGPHGSCESGHCICQVGWEGNRCNEKQCDARCKDHGVCSNGTCLCTNGWNGKHCTLEGCPNNCNSHGQCKTNQASMEWECLCESGWFGPGCNIFMEQDCSNDIDDDQDGLMDCEDPECCESPVCKKSQLCHTVPQPIDILLRKQPPAITASFFERMKFIIEDKGLQSYVQRAGFNESRAAVVRGQVFTPSGMGLIGVRVSTTLPNEGFTMTRDDGWFDLMVNGGGSVMLQFGRNPYPPHKLNIFVPWNEVIVLDPVVLGQASGGSKGIANENIPTIGHGRPKATTCREHDFSTMKPLVLASWKNGFQGQIPDQSAVILETRAIQESLAIPGSDMFLVYHSARSKGYMSIIQLQLTPDVIPPALVKVHVKITIEGVVHEKLFEADPNIQYTYAWDRLNEYRQRVYGITTAIVKVGYEYKNCESLIWNIQTTKMSGHVMDSSDLGGWELNVQHKYNFHAGILQKGDGHTVYLKYKPHVVTTVMGNGEQRSIDCNTDACANGEASKQKLLGPKALASAADGSVFVADYDLIRRITPDGEITSLLKLNTSRVSYRYHMAHCTYNYELEKKQTLYISQPESHQIIRMKRVPLGKAAAALSPYALEEDLAINPEELDSNWEVFIGNGERCLPGDSDHCGDGGKAENARLAYPKGIAVAADGRVFVADGSNIRSVDENGIITTLIGHQYHRSNWKPLPCEGAISIRDVQLNWPTELAISPLDNSLHLIDDNVVLKVTHDDRISIVAGRPLHCPPPPKSKDVDDLATSATLVEPQSISFSPNGDLFIAESDSQRINRIRRVSTDGKISTFAGKDSKCNCLDISCLCFESDQFLAAKVKFSAISAITCAPDGVVYIADQGNYRLRAISSSLPPEHSDGVFEVPDTDAQEMYIFNKFGQHVLTKDIMTSNILYKMTYSQATSNGKLTSVADPAGRTLTIMRDYRGNANALQTSNGLKNTLKMSHVGYLESFETPSKYQVEFKYLRPQGLLKSKLDSQDKAYVYEYDQYGRLIMSISPTGQTVSLAFNLTSTGGAITVEKDGERSQILRLNEDLVVSTLGEQATEVISIGADKTLTDKTSWSQTTTLGTIPHPVIAVSDPVMGDSFPMVGEQLTYLGTNLVNKLNWEYLLATNGHNGQMMGIKKTLKVNGENLLTIFFDKLQRREVFYSGTKSELIEVRYDSLSRPIRWEPLAGGFSPVDLGYDRFGHLNKWSRGQVSEEYTFDKAGRLNSIQRGNATLLTYHYAEAYLGLPNSISTGQGSKFILDYEDKTGGLKSIQTPRGHFHSFRLRPGPGFLRFQYLSPWSEQHYEILFDSEGKIRKKVFPGVGNEAVYFFYNPSGSVKQYICGDIESTFDYDEDTGNLDTVVTRQGHGFDLKARFKYHGGLLKEQKLRFTGGFPDLENAIFRHQYDGFGRPSTMIATIGSQDQQESWPTVYNANTGLLENMGKIRVSRPSPNKTMLQDNNNNYFKSVERDENNRLQRITFGLRRREMLSIHLSYDSQNRVSQRRIMNQEGRPSEEKFSFSPDGHLLQVWGPDNFDYRYDANGNLIGEGSSRGPKAIQYDAGDRVERIDTSTRVIYDPKGFVGQVGDHEKFWHDASGKLIQYLVLDKEATAGTRVSFFYDYLGRLVAWQDTRGHIQQFFYANVKNERELTHVHHPKSGLTQRLLYDENGHLIALKAGEQMLFVATDQMGSPILVFSEDGTVLKEIEYSPFGTTVKDTNPGMILPLGFHGGIALPHSKFLFMSEGRIYHPELLQYLNPDWESLQGDLTNPLALFVYRFRNNDPINPALHLNYMTHIEEWSKLFGLDLDNILDSSQRGYKEINSLALLRSEILPSLMSSDLRVITGMAQALTRARESMPKISFIKTFDSVSTPMPILLNARIASKPMAFGRGFLLSVIDDISVVHVVEGVQGVVQKIFESVLNGTGYLDSSFLQSADKSVYYFATTADSQLAIDRETVNRLAGEYDVAVRDVDNNDKDLKIDNSELVVHVIYGQAIVRHRENIQKDQSGLASQLAWTREKSLIQAGFSGVGDWTKGQKAELVMGHRIRGFTAVEIHPRNRYPDLVRDASNYFFVSNGNNGESISGHRRKSRHGKTRKH
ncbi:teneurin-m-like isoform X2 [Tigriopus californicus]|uniref:teneurin-m-like isoform X2 n=1 Tax=Tigriopus californicus TaxID=6832 RepID=UPI0027DA2B5B|nr:teneurin-m-like isoform X2 [Tigriopus californicus]